MVMVVDANDSVELDRIPLHGRDQIVAALKHVHDVNPKTSIYVVSTKNATYADEEKMTDLIIATGLEAGHLDVYSTPASH